jgi:hypothetical protein
VDEDFYKSHKKGLVESIKLPNTNHICYKYPKAAVTSIYKADFESKNRIPTKQFILDHEKNGMRGTKGKGVYQSTNQADYQPFEVQKKKKANNQALEDVGREGLFMAQTSYKAQFANWGGGNYDRVRKVDPDILKFKFLGVSGYKKEFDWKGVKEPTKYDVAYMKDLRNRNSKGELCGMLGSPFEGKSHANDAFKQSYKFKQSGMHMPMDEVSFSCTHFIARGDHQPQAGGRDRVLRQLQKEAIQGRLRRRAAKEDRLIKH